MMHYNNSCHLYFFFEAAIAGIASNMETVNVNSKILLIILPISFPRSIHPEVPSFDTKDYDETSGIKMQ